MSKLNTRAQHILDTGARLAAQHGAANVTRRMVAQAATVSEALVSNYMGSAVDAQALYRKRAKAMGLKLPDTATEAQLGLQLRAHGPRDARDTRTRSQKERDAIKRKRPLAPIKRSAARQPKLPPLPTPAEA